MIQPQSIAASFMADDSFKLNMDEIDDFKNDDEEYKNIPDNKNELEESKIDQKKKLDQDTSKNLNDLVIKRMKAMMAIAINRRPLEGTEHENRVKEIREGKFKICVPAIALTFKCL